MLKLVNLIRNQYLCKNPTYLIFFITAKCNAACKICFNWANMKNINSELSKEEIVKTISSFRKLQQLTLTGGEPILRDDLSEIISEITKDTKISMISLPSNGIATEKIKVVSKDILQNINPKTHLRFAFSVYGIGEEHDNILQVRGAFSKLQKSYKALQNIVFKYKNANIDINIVACSYNKDTVIKTYNYCRDYFADSNVAITIVRGNPREKDAKNISATEYTKIAEYFLHNRAQSKNKPFAKLLKAVESLTTKNVLKAIRNKKMPSKCYAGKKMLVINHNGDVYPCEPLWQKSGNIKDHAYDIHKLIASKQHKNNIQLISQRKCYCTWECAHLNNVVCNPLLLPAVFYEMYN